MRVFGRTGLVLAAVVALAAPASAGSADNPEITDVCGAQVMTGDTVRVVPNHVDICAGWFSTTANGLQVNLRMSGIVEETGGFWAVWWDSGNCTYEVAVDDSVGADHAQSFTVGCGTPPAPTCPVPNLAVNCDFGDHYRTFALPDSAVVRDQTLLRIAVDFTGPLAEFAGDHSPGRVLSDPRAASSATVGPVYAWMRGCSFSDDGATCFEANGDATAEGRDYTVGA